MAIIRSYDRFKKGSKINESSNDPVTLYRVVAVGDGEPLVVDTKSPGKYYFRHQEEINLDALKKRSNEYHVIEVNTTESNIDEELSEIESEKNGCECVVLKSETAVAVMGITPLND